MQPIPTLTTSRLTLRPMRFDDWPAYRQLMASERAHLDGDLLFMGRHVATKA